MEYPFLLINKSRLFILLAFVLSSCSAPAAPVEVVEDVPTAEAVDIEPTVAETTTEQEAVAEADATETDTVAAVAPTEGVTAAEEQPAAEAEPANVSLASNYLGSYTYDANEFGTQVTVTVDEAAQTRTISANALPNHDTGEFPNPGNPNTISAQDRSYVYPTNPVYVGNPSFARTPGVAISGVKFEPDTAERATCETGEVHSIEAIQDATDLGLDFNRAHVQPTGEYHYHGVSTLLVEAFNSDQDLVHVGFAADGHLIYYSKSGAYQPSYRIGDGPRAGTNCTYPLPRNSGTLEFGPEKDGALKSDWLFDQSLGDLDECNGINIDGQYIYLITEGYPYVPRCLMGEFAGQGGPGGGGGGQGQGGNRPEGGGQGQGGAPGQGGGGGRIDFAAGAEALGISEDALRDALGGRPPNFEAAAETLGISVEELRDALGVQERRGGGGGGG